MSEANKANAAKAGRKGRAAAIGLGLSAASLFAASSAEAATEVASLAAGDGRPALFLALFAPALIWVGVNIAGPALNQINAMQSADKPAAKGGKKGGRR